MRRTIKKQLGPPLTVEANKKQRVFGFPADDPDTAVQFQKILENKQKKKTLYDVTPTAQLCER